MKGGAFVGIFVDKSGLISPLHALSDDALGLGEMDNSSRHQSGDHAGPARRRCVDQNEVGAHPTRDAAAIAQPSSAGGRGGDEGPRAL
jgi:hypothetical protein